MGKLKITPELFDLLYESFKAQLEAISNPQEILEQTLNSERLRWNFYHQVTDQLRYDDSHHFFTGYRSTNGSIIAPRRRFLQPNEKFKELNAQADLTDDQMDNALKAILKKLQNEQGER